MQSLYSNVSCKYGLFNDVPLSDVKWLSSDISDATKYVVTLFHMHTLLDNFSEHRNAVSPIEIMFQFNGISHIC